MWVHRNNLFGVFNFQFSAPTSHWWFCLFLCLFFRMKNKTKAKPLASSPSLWSPTESQWESIDIAEGRFCLCACDYWFEEVRRVKNRKIETKLILCWTAAFSHSGPLSTLALTLTWTNLQTGMQQKQIVITLAPMVQANLLFIICSFIRQTAAAPTKSKPFLPTAASNSCVVWVLHLPALREGTHSNILQWQTHRPILSRSSFNNPKY